MYVAIYYGAMRIEDAYTRDEKVEIKKGVQGSGEEASEPRWQNKDVGKAETIEEVRLCLLNSQKKKKRK